MERDNIQVEDQQKRKRKKARSAQTAADAKPKKKRKSKHNKKGIDDLAHAMDNPLIETSPTDITDNEQPDAIENSGHKRSKKLDLNSYGLVNTNSPPDESISDILHSEWRISKERMSDFKSKGNFSVVPL